MLEDSSKSGAKDKGIATHMFMQFCDFDSVDKYGASLELARLVSKKFLDRFSAELVDLSKIEKFFSSDLYKEMKLSKKLYREKRFNVMLPAKDFTENIELFVELESKNSQILVQGVMDAMFEREDKTLCIVDYKTDQIKGTRDEVESVLIERYKDQLTYYKSACEKITGQKVSRLLIWSFAISDTVEVKI